LLRYLAERGIRAGIHYPRPVHKEPAYQHLGRGADLSHAEQAVAQVLSLPLYPELDDRTTDHVVRAVRAYFGAA
jgi:perosamine synthetase